MKEEDIIKELVKFANKESGWDLFNWLQIINRIQTKAKQYYDKFLLSLKQ